MEYVYFEKMRKDIDEFFVEHPMGKVTFSIRYDKKGLEISNRLGKFGVLTVEGEEKMLYSFMRELESRRKYRMRYEGDYFFTYV